MSGTSGASNNIEQSERLKNALVTMQKLRSRLEAVERARYEPIAVIGIGCRFPGDANSPEAFWQLLRAGVDTVREIPPDRWTLHEYYDPDSNAPGKMYTRYGSYLSEIDTFDSQFFGIAPREAAGMDPQQRVALEVCWEALENAGVVADQLGGSKTGVFIGVMNIDYLRLQLTKLAPEQYDPYIGMGIAWSFIAGRISYVLGLHGPSMVVDTACSSSLVAVHLACQSLRSGECRMALAGGINLMFVPEPNILLCKLGVLSTDGRCKAFDASADGYGRGEGCGMIVLKRLSDAIADGDTILAVIRGSAVNHDGASGGLTVPNGQAHQALIREALSQGKVEPAEIDYVEAHGTGTSLGDPIEVRALWSVLGPGRPKRHPLRIGSVKSNFGHLEGAAGISGLIKTILALRHEQIPPHLHVKEPTPLLAWDSMQIEIPQQCIPWTRGEQRRVAGVNSFGLSGINAHVVVEEAPIDSQPQPAAPEVATDRAYLLPLSARSQKALRALAGSFRALLSSDSAPALRDICYTASMRRSAHDHRLAVAGKTHRELAERLEAFTRDEARPGMTSGRSAPDQHHKVVFVFSGQGSQWYGMARQMLAHEPAFRQTIEACAEVMKRYVSWSLFDYLHGDASGTATIDIIQPTLFAIQIGLAAVWRSRGVEPAAVVGHSMGEIAAAYVAGALSLEDAAQVICRRSRLLLRISGRGLMAVVDLSLAETQAALAGYEDRLAVAASNGPRSTVLSGDPDALRELIARLEQREIFCRLVNVDVASHSPQIDPLRDELLQQLAPIQPQQARVPFYSTVSNTRLEGPELETAYWVSNVRQPVLLWPAIQRLVADKHSIFIELSPHPVLLHAVKSGLQHLDCPEDVLPSMRHDEDELIVFNESLGALWTLGYPVDWSRLDSASGRFVTLPTYAWQRERFWLPIDETNGKPKRGWIGRNEAALHPLLGTYLPLAHVAGAYVWETTLDLQTTAYLQDHRVQGTAVVPAAAFVEMALAAAGQIAGAQIGHLEDLAFHETLYLPHGTMRTLQVVLTPQMPGTSRVQIFSQPVGAEDSQTGWTLHASITIRQDHGASLAPEPGTPLLAQAQQQCREPVGAAGQYAALRKEGLEYDARFQGLEQLWKGEGAALGRVRLPPALHGDTQRYNVHPALLDACFQVSLLRDGAGSMGISLPVAFERLKLYARPDTALWSYTTAVPHPSSGELLDDLFVFDDAGKLVVEVRGIRARRLETGAGRANAEDRPGWYAIAWQPQQPARSETQTLAGEWLLFADRRGVALQLQALLEARGARCTLVVPAGGQRRQEPGVELIDPARPEDLQRVIQPDRLAHSGWRGIIHLWGLDCPPLEQARPEMLATAELLGPTSALYLSQAIARMGEKQPPRLWLITSGAQAVEARDAPVAVTQAPLWGFGRTLAHEHPELRCTLIDLGPASAPAELEQLCDELAAEDREDQVALRGARRYVARLAPWTAQESTPRRGILAPAAGRPFRLEIDTPGVLDDLVLRETARRAPGAGEVEIAVRAAGLNFLDVLSAMGIRPDIQPVAPPMLGGECAGVVVAIGEGVYTLAVGDEVVAIAPYSFGSFVTTPAALVAPKPGHLTFEEAATIPIAFITSYYALHHLGRLTANERVLIHAASGGTGLAAVQLAQRAGAQIFATAGNQQKREFLRSLGIGHVMDSRSLAFADQVLASTDGRGVDVVLNSLTGEALHKSLAVVAPYGRFLEIGKRDIYQNTQVGLLPFRKNLSYSAIDLAAMMTERPELCGALLREVIDQFAARRLRPLPIQAFSIRNVAEAFRTMAQARHIGKIVVTLDDPDVPIAPAADQSSIRPDATYWIAGGLGGIGLTTARWLVQQGARHLVLSGRREPSDAARRAIQGMAEAGAEVVTASVDVAEEAQVAGLLARIAQSMPPLRGVIHSAAVLDDGIALQQTRERMQRVMAPKVRGSWNVHHLTSDLQLDFVLFFSSMASVLGAPAQANYAAANAFQDGLAAYRRARGLAGLSVNWGPWAEVGLAAQQANRGERLSGQGMGGITPAQGMDALGRLLQIQAAQVGVMHADLQQWFQLNPAAAQTPLLSQLAQSAQQSSAAQAQASEIRALLIAAEPAQRRRLLETHMMLLIGKTLKISPSDLEAQQSLNRLGLDSLMAIELKNRIEADLGITLAVVKLLEKPTIAQLTDQLLERLTTALLLDSIQDRREETSAEDDWEVVTL